MKPTHPIGSASLVGDQYILTLGEWDVYVNRDSAAIRTYYVTNGSKQNWIASDRWRWESVERPDLPDLLTTIQSYDALIS